MPIGNSAREVDLVQLLQIFLKYKVKVIALCILGASALFAFSYYVPVIYKSTMTLVPVENNEELNPANLMGNRLGGLANLAGLNLGTQSSNVKLNIEIIQSRQFVLNFVKTHDLTLDLIAAEKWIRQSNSVEYDDELYDAQSQGWVIENEYISGQYRAPSNAEIYETFQEAYSVNFDSETGLVNISMKHVSPHLAKDWLEKFVKFANERIRETALQESERKMEYLSEKMGKTQIESIRSIFFQLIENELQNKMLIDTRQEFAYKLIDPPFLPEEKFAPRRIYYAVLGGLITFIIIFITLLSSLFISAYRDSRSEY